MFTARGSYASRSLFGTFVTATFFEKPLREALVGEESVISFYEHVRKLGNDLPYPMFPEKGGLLPFGSVNGVHNLNWLTNGPPDKWQVVYWFFDGLEFIQCGDSFSRFLLKLLRHEYLRRELPVCDEPFGFQAKR